LSIDSKFIRFFHKFCKILLFLLISQIVIQISMPWTW
jgi:hypothetical protein